jgi:hypothetical protein
VGTAGTAKQPEPTADEPRPVGLPIRPPQIRFAPQPNELDARPGSLGSCPCAERSSQDEVDGDCECGDPAEREEQV